MPETSKVICNFCGKHYDLGKVKVTARYADATCFITPCCGKQADDREWKSSPDFRRTESERRCMFGAGREVK